MRLVCWVPSTYMRYEFYYTFYHISGVDAPRVLKRLSRPSAMWLRHDAQAGSVTKRTLLQRNGLRWIIIRARVSTALDVPVLKEKGMA
jgi:hypothetical protein